MCCGNGSISCRHYLSDPPTPLTRNLGSTQRAANSKQKFLTMCLLGLLKHSHLHLYSVSPCKSLISGSTMIWNKNVPEGARIFRNGNFTNGCLLLLQPSLGEGKGKEKKYQHRQKEKSKVGRGRKEGRWLGNLDSLQKLECCLCTHCPGKGIHTGCTKQHEAEQSMPTTSMFSCCCQT